jgi:uncharacterized iron-regulated membrane protein
VKFLGRMRGAIARFGAMETFGRAPVLMSVDWRWVWWKRRREVVCGPRRRERRRRMCWEGMDCDWRYIFMVMVLC